MTIQPTKLLTEAETALFDAAPNDSDALTALREAGLPTRRMEAYHYTDLRALLKDKFKAAPKPDEKASLAIGDKFPRLVDNACVIHFRDGHFFDKGEKLPEGVSMTTDMPAAHSSDTNAANAVGLINAAFVSGGATLTVADGAQIEQTVGLAYAQTGAQNIVAAQAMSIKAGANSKSRFIERAVGLDGVAYLSSCVVDLEIGDDAELTYVLSNEEGDAATRLARLSVSMGENAKLNLFILNVGGKLVRQEILFDLKGENADLNIAGINLIGGEAHIDVTSIIDHRKPSGVADEIFRNVATERGRGVFQGRINVNQPAQLTDAKMACNTLLLSDDCDFSAKPELEIFADDVQCAHGATVTDLEESYLFYLMARGISETKARRMLIEAFVSEAFDDMEDETLKERLNERIHAWMEKHV